MGRVRLVGRAVAPLFVGLALPLPTVGRAVVFPLFVGLALPLPAVGRAVIFPLFVGLFV